MLVSGLASLNVSSRIIYLPVISGILDALPPVGRGWVLQAAQPRGHLLQGISLGFMLTGDHLSLRQGKAKQGAPCQLVTVYML